MYIFVGFFNMVPQFNKMMNNDIKTHLQLPSYINWSFLSNDVYYNLQGDLMRSVTDKGR